MAWVYLIVAGLFEITWAIGLKYAEGFTRLVPSVIYPCPLVARIAVHMLVLPERHYLHLRHSGVYSGMT